MSWPCGTCNNENDDATRFCGNCGAPRPGGAPGQEAPSSGVVQATARAGEAVAPPTAQPHKASHSKTIVIFVAIGVFLICLCPIVGIISAIAIPNFLDAIERSRQKRTVGEIKCMATAMQSFATDFGGYPPSRLSGDPNVTLTPLTDAKGVRCIVPDLIVAFPVADAWGTPYLYSSGPDGTEVNEQLGSVTALHFTIGSLASDRAQGGGGDPAYSDVASAWCSSTSESPPNYETHCYQADIIWGDNSFLQAPEGKQRKC